MIYKCCHIYWFFQENVSFWLFIIQIVTFDSNKKKQKTPMAIFLGVWTANSTVAGVTMTQIRNFFFFLKKKGENDL